MKYAVTFCSMDEKLGANPFWHGCFLLSKIDEATKKLQVVDSWGFYGLPATDEHGSWQRALKIRLKLDVDLKGNHGMWRHEETRHLDQGVGLHGITFELTEDKFNTLATKCQAAVDDQEKAIAEMATFLGLTAKPAKQTRIYPYEDYSALIFAMEKVKAKEAGREPRLKPFEFRASIGLFGPSLRESRTCKSQAIELLSSILSTEQINLLTENGKHPSVPKYSGSLENIYLHSTGPLSVHTKKSGEQNYFRGLISEDVKVFWTVPPQKSECLSDDSADLIKADSDYCTQIKSVASKLQRLEWLLRNARVEDKYMMHKEKLIQQVITYYELFSVIEPNKDKTKISGFFGFALSLFELPRSLQEKKLQNNIQTAKSLFNSLYMAIVDDWSIEKALANMSPAAISDELGSNRAEGFVSSEEELTKKPDIVDYSYEAVVAHFSVADKKALCNIIGRTYCEPQKEELIQDKLILRHSS